MPNQFIFWFRRAFGKEIPDDDILKSTNDRSKSLDSLLETSQQIELGPIDGVIRSILSLNPTYLKEEVDDIKELTQPEHPGTKDAGDDVMGTTENSTVLDDGDEGSGMFDNEEYYYHSDGDDYADDDNNSTDDIDDNNEDKTLDESGNNVLDADNMKENLFSDIDILPLDYDLEDPWKLQNSISNYSILLDTLLGFFQKETKGVLSESRSVSTDTKGQDKAVTSKAGKVRAKRSLYPRHTGYEYIWSWHYPFKIFVPYRKSFDTIASGIIGKRSQFDYSEDDLRPIDMNWIDRQQNYMVNCGC